MNIHQAKDLKAGDMIEAIPDNPHIGLIFKSKGLTPEGKPIRLKIVKNIIFTYQPKKIMLSCIDKQGERWHINHDEIECFIKREKK